MDQFCQNGQCTMVCAGPCPPGETCVNGSCQMDPCASTHCPSGEICVVKMGVAMCTENTCAGGCDPTLVCCGGACMADPCSGISCPAGSACQVDPSTCAPACQAVGPTPHGEPKDQIVGAGGGGVGCSASGSSTGNGAALIAFALLLCAFARRRSRV
jgi:hypothetical protein